MMTHDEIADFAADKMRKKGYKLTWSNMRSLNVGEQPDVMSIRGLNDVVIIEVKISRSDFFADKKKPWRNGSHLGMGTQRIYLTPPNLLKPTEIPFGWQLWEIHPRGKGHIIKVIKGEVKRVKRSKNEVYSATVWEYPNMDDPKERWHFRDNNLDCKRSAAQWLISIMLRMGTGGVEVEKYGNCEHLIEIGAIKKGLT